MTIKSVFITGISSGFGYAITKILLKKGTFVYALGRKCPHEFTVNKKFNFLEFDLSNLDILHKEISKFLEKVFSIDLVFLNAALFKELEFLHKISMTDITEVMSVNVWSNKLIIDFLLEKKDVTQIVALSSSAGRSELNSKNKVGHNIFSLSKSCLNNMISQYALENKNTHFVALSPGYMDTPMSRKVVNEECSKDFPDIVKYKRYFQENKFELPINVAKKIIGNIDVIRQFESGAFIRMDNENNIYVSKTELVKSTFSFI